MAHTTDSDRRAGAEPAPAGRPKGGDVKIEIEDENKPEADAAQGGAAEQQDCEVEAVEPEVIDPDEPADDEAAERARVEAAIKAGCFLTPSCHFIILLHVQVQSIFNGEETGSCSHPFFRRFYIVLQYKKNGNGYHARPRFFQYVFVYFYFRLLPKTYPRGKPISIRRHLYAFISNW